MSGSYGAASAPVLPSRHATSWPGSQADTPRSKQTNTRRQLGAAAGGGGAGALRQESWPPFHPEARTAPEPRPPLDSATGGNHDHRPCQHGPLPLLWVGRGFWVVRRTWVGSSGPASLGPACQGARTGPEAAAGCQPGTPAMF